MTTEARFAKLLSATPDQLATIDGVLEGKAIQETTSMKLFTLSSAARKLGVSRATVWRMVTGGSLRTIYIRDNAKRIAESELVRIARGVPIN